ncbi:hypothetical protein JCM15519_11650 [Fundidesulfovibrio butyratiphilus]
MFAMIPRSRKGVERGLGLRGAVSRAGLAEGEAASPDPEGSAGRRWNGGRWPGRSGGGDYFSMTAQTITRAKKP